MSSTQTRAVLFETQRRVLEAFARGADLDVILRDLCEQVEVWFGGGERCSISIARNGRFVRSIAPSLPRAYARMMHGMDVGPRVGSCGAAVSTGEPVIVTDVQTDPRWEDYRALAELVAPSGCWATPVFARREEGAIASFAVYGPPGATPSEEQREFLEGLADVTGLVISRAQLEEEFTREQVRLENVLAGTNVGVWEWNPQTGERKFSSRGLELLGHSQRDVDGRTELALVHPEDRARMREAIDRHFAGKSEFFESEVRLRHPDREWIWVLDRGWVLHRDEQGQPVRVLGTIQDITARKQNAANLQRIQRMESLGELAGGIAHDFNNILVGVFGGIELAQIQLSEDHPAQEDLRIAAESLERAKALTGQLLTFAKGGEPLTTEVDLAGIVPRAVQFGLSGSSVKPVLEIPDGLWRAKADRCQLEQVFSNLILNAREAMDDGSHLHVELNNVFLENREVPDGPYVRASVRDGGCGIPPENLDRLFDPYFSTREGGSGLGLTTVHSIVTRHGGTIAVESTVGEGTTFTFFIPAITDAEEASGDDTESPDRIVDGGHVLVMDDEPEVRRVCVAMLEKLGWATEAAPDGETAVSLYRARAEQGDPFDLVVMDLTVPGGMGGKVAVRRLLEFDPDARVIASSGYADDAVLANPEDHGFVGILPKPYTYAELRESIRGVLSSTWA